MKICGWIGGQSKKGKWENSSEDDEGSRLKEMFRKMDKGEKRQEAKQRGEGEERQREG